MTWVVPAGEIDAFVEDVGAHLTTGPPVALAQTKALLNEGFSATLSEALANEARAQPINLATADAPEAYAAFAEKRTPAFTGRWAVPPRARHTGTPPTTPADDGGPVA